VTGYPDAPIAQGCPAAAIERPALQDQAPDPTLKAIDHQHVDVSRRLVAHQISGRPIRPTEPTSRSSCDTRDHSEADAPLSLGRQVAGTPRRIPRGNIRSHCHAGLAPPAYPTPSPVDDEPSPIASRFTLPPCRRLLTPCRHAHMPRSRWIRCNSTKRNRCRRRAWSAGQRSRSSTAESVAAPRDTGVAASTVSGPGESASPARLHPEHRFKSPPRRQVTTMIAGSTCPRGPAGVGPLRPSILRTPHCGDSAASAATAHSSGFPGSSVPIIGYAKM
jgi:hypothetical protein